MNVGAEPKKVAMLAGLVVAAGATLYFNVIATDSLGRVHIQISTTKPNDDEIRAVLKLNDARVAAPVQVRLHTVVEARRSPFVRCPVLPAGTERQTRPYFWGEDRPHSEFGE